LFLSVVHALFIPFLFFLDNFGAVFRDVEGYHLVMGISTHQIGAGGKIWGWFTFISFVQMNFLGILYFVPFLKFCNLQ
jgi:hypothetical protein